MKSKRNRLFIAVILFILASCEFEVPKDPFQVIDSSVIFSEAMTATLAAEGQLVGKPFVVNLTFTPEEMMLFGAISWELKDGFGEVIDSRVDTATLGEGDDGEVVVNWAEGYTPTFEVAGLSIGDYKLIATVYDTFEKVGEEISFENSGFSRVFVLDFFVWKQKFSSTLKVVGLGTDGDGTTGTTQDTGISSTDRITMLNTGLHFIGITNVAPAILNDSNTTISFVLTKNEDGAVPSESDPSAVVDLGSVADPSFGGLIYPLIGWKWLCGEVLADGRWLVELKLAYTDSATGEEIVILSAPYIFTIDATAPVIKWDYWYNNGNVISNQEGHEIIEINEYPTFSWDAIGDGADEAMKANFLNWGGFSFEDGSAVSKLVDSDLLYQGTNFIASNEGEGGHNGFNPLIAGVQEVQVHAWDLAGNKAEVVKRRVSISEPLPPKEIMNPGFDDGVGITTANARPSLSGEEENGSFKGWMCDVWGHRDRPRKFFPLQSALNENSQLDGGTPESPGPFLYSSEWPWDLYYQVFVSADPNVSEDGGNFAFFLGENSVNNDNEITFRNQSGEIWQEGFQLYAHVKYTFSYFCASNAELLFSDRGIVEGMGEVKFSITERADSDFTLERQVISNAISSGMWEENVISFIPNKSGEVKLILEKMHIGNKDGLSTSFDGVKLEVAVDGIPKVDPTVLAY